jgi:hypothetical protein
VHQKILSDSNPCEARPQAEEILKVIYFPKGSSELNAIEECRRQGKYEKVEANDYYREYLNLNVLANNDMPSIEYRIRERKLL